MNLIFIILISLAVLIFIIFMIRDYLETKAAFAKTRKNLERAIEILEARQKRRRGK